MPTPVRTAEELTAHVREAFPVAQATVTYAPL